MSVKESMPRHEMTESAKLATARDKTHIDRKEDFEENKE